MIPMTAAALVLASARRRTSGSSEGGTLRDDSVEDQGPVPSIGMDDETPLGDSPEVHGTISPRDLPVGHPGRQEAERQAGGWGGRTRGDREGGATGTRRPLSPEHEDVLEGGEHAAAREGRWPSAD